MAESLIEGEYNSFYDRSVLWLKLYLDSNYPKQNKLSLGTFGCYLSHYFALKKYSSMYSSIVILEDDVQFNIQCLKNFFMILNKVKSNDVDICRPLRGIKMTDFFINEFLPSIYEFNCPYKHSLFVENTYHEKFGATHFVYYHNIKCVIDFLDSERVFNIDAIYSTNYINSILLTCKIFQKRRQFVSSIGSFLACHNSKITS